MEQFLAQNWKIIAFVVGYILLTCMNHLPDQWQGFYPYFRDCCRSLAASPPAARFEAKYNLTTPDGTSTTKTVSTTETPAVKP